MAESSSLQYQPTWVVAAVCFLIILISLLAERGLTYLGKCLKRNNQDTLFEALQKLKSELMLLGFISLLLNISQGLISQICIPTPLESVMLPCKKPKENESHERYLPQAINNRRRLFSTESGNSNYCSDKGKFPLLSTESFHQLHNFVFVVAVVHVVSCAIILVLGRARIREWKPWEDGILEGEMGSAKDSHTQHLQTIRAKFAWGYWRKAAVISWTMSLIKQFYRSVTKSEYVALREGFIMTHCPTNQKFDFYNHIMQSLEIDFRHVVGISLFQWLFLVVFLTLNVAGWNTYFWLSFLPLVLLLLVGAKLKHIIVRLVQDVDEMKKHPGHESASVRPSDEYFWFNRPRLVLDFIHFILFQNAFEIAFFVWIWWTYGYHSCMMGKNGYIIARLVTGLTVQVLCSYITLPLYALVTKMGTNFDSSQPQQAQSPVII